MSVHDGRMCGAVERTWGQVTEEARCYSSVGRLKESGMNGGRLKAVGLYGIFIWLSNASAVVQVEHRLPSGGPQLQALTCTQDYLRRIQPCPSPTGSFVNLG